MAVVVVKLTPRQRAVLMAMKDGAELHECVALRISDPPYIRLTGNSAETVRMATLLILRKRGLIVEITQTHCETRYRISPAGRAALEGGT